MKVLVVYKKSAFEIYSQSQDQAMQDFLTQNTEDVQRLRQGHEQQKIALEEVVSALEHYHHEFNAIYRADLSREESLHRYNLVISLGGDGTFLEVSHYITDTPVLSVNSDPTRSTGFFSCANVHTIDETIQNLDTFPRTVLPRLEIEVDRKKVPELAVNDVLLAHRNPAATTRYVLEEEGEKKEYKTSGLLIAAPAGSTAWIYEEGGIIMPLTSEQMQYMHRGKRNSHSVLVNELKVHSLTREGKIYIDGEHICYDFTLGSEVVITKGPSITILGDLHAKRATYPS